MKTLFHSIAGRVDVDVDGPGFVELTCAFANGTQAAMGEYDDEAAALSDLEAMMTKVDGRSVAYWTIISMRPEEPVPVFDSAVSGATQIGIASARPEADRMLEPVRAFYCPPGFGPDGEEGWIPA